MTSDNLIRKEGEILEIRQRKGKKENNNFFRERVVSFYKQNVFLEIIGGCYKNKN